MGFQPSTKHHILTLVTDILRQGSFTAVELFDRLTFGQQIGYGDLQELLDEKVKDGTFRVTHEPIKRYSLASL
jgi:hypothetical protein